MSIREDLELDISSAESSIDRVGADLAQAAQLFKNDLADALNVLQNVQVDPQVDMAAISTDITDAVASADSTVQVEADATAVTDETQLALFDVDTVLPIDADTSQAQAELASLEGETVTVAVEADTAQAQSDIQALNDTANGAAGGVDALGGAVTGLAAAGGLATGSTGGLKSAISGTSVAAGAAVAGVGILASVTDKYFQSAVNATAATERFDQTFGPLADSVEAINVGNLNTDLAALNLSLGSSTAEVRNVLSSYAQLGQSAGATGQEIAGSSEQLVALAARAVALNPALGSVGEVANGLTRALARGGRFAAQYGISLNSAEINAKALEIAQARGSNEVQQFDKVMAGATLATAKYGDTLQETITKGTENPIIQLKALRAELNKTITEAGKPLIAPVFEILNAAQPVLKSVVSLFGSLLSAILPLGSAALQGIGPIVTALNDGLKKALEALKPGIAALAESLPHILDGFAPAIEAVGPVIEAFGRGLGIILQFAADLIDALGPVVPAILGIVVALKLLSLAAATNPFLALAAAALILIGALAGLNQEVDGFAQFTQEVDAQAKTAQTALYGNATAANELTTALAAGEKGWSEYITTQSEFGKDPKVLAALQESGIGLDKLRGELQTGVAGWKDFIAAAVDAGQIEIQVDGVTQTGDDVRQTTDLMKLLGGEQGKNVKKGDELTAAFNRQQIAQEEAAKATVNQLILTGQLTQEQVDQAAAISESTYGFSSYQVVLQQVSDTQSALGQAIQQQNFPLQTNTGFWLSLSQAIAAGDVTSKNMGTTLAGVAAQLGLTDEQLATYVQGIETGVQAITDSITANIPTAADAFSKLGESTDPKVLQYNLALQQASVEKFTENLRTLLGQGQIDLVQLLASQGAQAAAGVTDAIVNAGPATATALEGQVDQFKGSQAELEAFLRNEATPAIAGNDGALADLAKQGTDALGLNLNFDQAATGPVADLNSYLLSGPANAAADQSGNKTGETFGDGMAAGMHDSQPDIEAEARRLVQEAEAAARDEADSHSPSRLFAALGEDISAGIAVGIGAGTAGVTSAVQDVIATASQVTVAPVVTASLAPAALAAPVAAPTPQQQLTQAAATQPLVGKIEIVEAAAPRTTASETVNALRELQYRQG